MLSGSLYGNLSTRSCFSVRPILSWIMGILDTKDEKNSEMDIKYPLINYFDDDLDIKYLLMVIFYLKNTK